MLFDKTSIYLNMVLDFYNKYIKDKYKNQSKLIRIKMKENVNHIIFN